MGPFDAGYHPVKGFPTKDSARRVVRGAVALKDLLSLALLCTYVLAAHFCYYITLVPFGLLEYLKEERGFTDPALRAPLAALALAGVVSGLLAGIALDRFSPRPRRRFMLMAVIALALAFCARAGFLIQTGFTPFFGLLGLLLGTQIVLALGAFSTHIPARLLGIFAGLGAGVAYLAANLIVAYADGPAQVGVMSAGLCVSCALAIALFSPSSENLHEEAIGRRDGGLGSMVIALAPLAFLVLVDSYSFYPVGRSDLWARPVLATPADWSSNGVWHLLFAGIFGLSYFRFGRRKLLMAACAALMAATVLCYLNLDNDMAGLVRPLYSMAVGGYTVILFAVFAEVVPANRPMTGIALGMALVGWTASPSGIAASRAVELRFGLEVLYLISAIAALLLLAALTLVPLASRSKGAS